MYVVIFNRQEVGRYETIEDAYEAMGHLEAIGVPGRSIKIEQVQEEQEDEDS